MMDFHILIVGELEKHDKFRIGDKVIHKGAERTVFDIDYGYDILALDGDKYISPGHEDNRCIEAPFDECARVPLKGR